MSSSFWFQGYMYPKKGLVPHSLMGRDAKVPKVFASSVNEQIKIKRSHDQNAVAGTYLAYVDKIK
jgi:hypothetical protein